jgi:transcriptional regulator with XRE-family HTH domain
MPRTAVSLPIPVARSVRILGQGIRAARLRRRLRGAVLAERARISLSTMWKVERGDPAVSLGTYATVLWVLGLSDDIGQLAAPASDAVGLDLETERLPKRVRVRRPPATAGP